MEKVSDVENELEDVVMIPTSTKVINESRLSSVHLQSENDAKIPESSNNVEEQVQILSTTACTAQSSLTTAVDQIETVNDLGALLLPSKTNAEISATMSKLSNSQKYCLLYNHVSPPSILPSSYSYGCN